MTISTSPASRATRFSAAWRDRTSGRITGPSWKCAREMPPIRSADTMGPKGHPMEPTALAEALLGQLRQTADIRALTCVRRVRVLIGGGYGVSAEQLIVCFTKAYRDTCFDGAETDVQVLQAGQDFTPPGADGPTTASGYEIFIVDLEGD